MGRLIEFYVPDDFKKTDKPASSAEAPQVIEFPRSKREGFAQVTWIFPEVDSDLG
jgi:hypothetical protein